MSKAPSMPVFTDALIGDTTHLSIEEFGAYCMILMVTWRNNGVALPDDDCRMARICRVSVKRWSERLRPVLAGFFDLSEGVWRQGRLEKEWNYVANLSAIQSAKGKRSAEAKSLKNNKTCSTAVDERLQPAVNPHPHTQEVLTIEADASMDTVKATPPPQDAKPEKPPRPDVELLFSEWWQHVPHKVNRGAAAKAYRIAIKKATQDQLVAGIRRYAEQERSKGTPKKFIAHPSSWLNGERWLDEPTAEGGSQNDRNRQPQRPAPGNAWCQLSREKLGGHSGNQAGSPAGWDGASIELEPSFAGFH